MDTVQEFTDIKGKFINYLNKGHLEQAQQLLEGLLSQHSDNDWALAELGWLHCQKGNLDNAIKVLVEAVNRKPDEANYHYRLGVVYWNAGHEIRLKAVEQFILAVKINPSYADAYRYLGHYYNISGHDKQRAAKCYQKCVNINPEDSEVGEALCDILDSLGQETLELSICHEASQKSPRAFWAWRRMGYIQANQNKWDVAVGSLQHAIRGYPTCADLWEALGHSYQKLGMLTAALKAYGRATSLDGNSRIFSFIQSGNILISLASYKKAIEQFRQALESVPHNLAAMYGLASALLGRAKECIALGAFGWAAELLKEASIVAGSGSHIFGNVAAIWKLLGDVQLFMYHCLPWETKESAVRDGYEAFRESVSTWKGKCLQAATLAKNAYAHALHLCPWQANLYKDICVSIEVINNGTFDRSSENAWCLSEVMALGALVLESFNAEFWVTLGCISKQKAIQQHSFIRALHLDGSDASAWAYLGKLYVGEGLKELARQAFDRARSANPLLSLPWAGMSANEYHEGVKVSREAFSNCLYAVQLMPVAEFQLGLGMLAAATEQLQSSKVFVALEQAVKRVPHWVEAHNLKGLALESRGDLISAIHSYRQGLYALQHFCKLSGSSCQYDVSLNLARVLCKAGRGKEAINECEFLDKADRLDSRGLQIYAVALWLIGHNDLAISAAKKAVKVSPEGLACVALTLLFQLTYHIIGPAFAMAKLLEFPKYIDKDFQFNLVAFAIAVLENSDKFRLFLGQNFNVLYRHERGPVLYSLLALRKEFPNDVDATSNSICLKKALHMYPQSYLLRNELALNQLSSGDWNSPNRAIRCIPSLTSLDTERPNTRIEILGAAKVACSNCGYCSSTDIVSSCRSRSLGCDRVQAIAELQRWCKSEPWNDNARYLLVLNLFQKAQNERFPRHLCQAIKRILASSRWDLFLTSESHISPYKKFQLHICASEIFLQTRQYDSSLKHATAASQESFSSSMHFLAHLQLARCFAFQQEWALLSQEYNQCLQLATDNEISWLTLVLLQGKFSLKDLDNTATFNRKQELSRKKDNPMWMAMRLLVNGYNLLRKNDPLNAQKAFEKACLTWPAEACLHIIHGAICMEIARNFPSSALLNKAVQSLERAKRFSRLPLPYVSLMLGQAQASLGQGQNKWEQNLGLESLAWPADAVPAEILFQRHLQLQPYLNRAMKSRESSTRDKIAEADKRILQTSRYSRQWLLQALHLNPACPRYWEAVTQKFLR